jgi:thiosulfate/3-mercaptopyruvate sulfurtransferase
MLTRTVFALFFALVSICTLGCEHSSTTTSASDGPPVPWTPADVVDGATVAKEIGGAAETTPIVIHVGPEILFKRGHVAGARYGGEAGSDEGLAKLEAVAKGLPKDRELVIYCGCCPRSDCPNIRPAFKKLKALGFRVKVLDMPENFRTDWANKGFPVDKG